MKTLDEVNAERDRLRRAFEAQANGTNIACPKCGAEMIDRCPGTVNASYPPSRTLDCPKCGYVGLETL